MGSSSTGKKHKKEKKHKHRSHSHERQRQASDDGEEEVTFDLTGDGADEDSNSGRHKHHHHHKHKKHKEHRHKHHKHREHDRRAEVISVEESDSDSSDCVEVPVQEKSNENEREISAPPPPQISKHADYERDRREHERERERDRERERERERTRERDRDKERERDRERERERYEREREMAYRRDRDSERERRERDSERERRERDSERERRDRDSERERTERERDRGERERERELRKRPGGRERSRSKSNTRGSAHSPVPENGAGDVLSIDETNKLRAKLGLKPLEFDSGPKKPEVSGESSASSMKRSTADKDLSAYKDEWGEFLHKPADNLHEKKQAEKMRDKLKQRKEKRFLEERLARIRTLGESDEEVDDTAKWVTRNKNLVDHRKEAERRAKALEEMDAEFGVQDLAEQDRRKGRPNTYSDKNLKGLRVEHDVDDFSEGRTVILTLKDQDVLDEEAGDTLVNVNMVDNARYESNVKKKKLKPQNYGYDVYEEQYDEYGNPIERAILEKYDEDIDGNEKRKNFVIGENLDEEREHRRKLLEIKTKLAGKRLETLQDTGLQLASDTFSLEELAKFKKPKKKVKKIRQKLKADDLLPLSNATGTFNFGSRNGRHREPEDEDVEMPEVKPDVKIEEDEDDLQRVLAKARKLKQKENIIKKPPDIDFAALSAEIKDEPNDESSTSSTAAAVADVADGNIVLNATAEFCRTLGDIPTYGMAGNRNEDSNDMMDFDVIEPSDDVHIDVHGNDEIPAHRSHGTWNSVNPDEVMQPADLDNLVDDVEERAILDEEPDVGAGVANALRLALSKGYLEKEEHNRPSNSKMAHLQAKNYSIEDKAAGEDDKFGRRDRFHSGPIMDFKDKDTFKPNVKLEYIDDNGRVLNLKEAFRYLSHKFHGKGPGKNKIEKRLKKMEQEGLMKTMSSTDTPLGTLTMLQQKQKETKTPYVVLSGSNKSTAGVSGASIAKFK